MANIDPIPNVPVPPDMGKPGGLGQRIERTLQRWVALGFNAVKDALASLFQFVLGHTFEGLERDAASIASPILDELADTPEVPESVRTMLGQVGHPQSQFTVGAALLALGGVVWGVLRGAMEPFARRMSHLVDRKLRTGLPDPGGVLSAFYRGEISQDYAKELFERMGLPDTVIKALWEIGRPRADVSTLLLAIHREERTQEEVQAELWKRGYTLSDTGLLLNTRKPIPGASDLVRFALREAWRDDIAQEYGYDQGRPAELTEWMSKQGFDDVWAKLAWRSHWDVPSAMQGFAMFHRGIIGYEQLTTLLKVNDIAPGWIDSLLGITYNLLTRVDVKRAIRYGKLTPEQVNEEYHKQGYNDRDAQILTEIAIHETVEETASLTRAAVEKAYRKGKVERAEAEALLEPLGVVGDVAEFYLDLVEYERDMALRDKRVANVEKRFKAGSIDLAESRSALDALGVSAAEIEVRLEEWQIESTSGVKRPSRSNLDEFVKQGVIDLGQYRGEMAQLNYSGHYVDWFAQSLAYERQVLAEKEAERARKEQERIEKARIKTDYNRAKAKIDVQIAEVNEAIASAQVAMVEAENERDLALSRSISVQASTELQRSYNPAILEANATIDQARVAIAEMRQSIAGVRERIAQIDRSLLENVDISEQEALRGERLSAQTSIAVLNRQISEANAAIARLKEAIERSEDAEEIVAFKREAASIEVRIADLEVEVASNRVLIEQIDEQLQVALSAESKRELQLERSGAQAEIRAVESEIAAVETEIRQVQAEREAIEAELDEKLSALPGRAETIDIKQTYAVIIDNLEQNIAEYRSQVARLRLQRSELRVEMG